MKTILLAFAALVLTANGGPFIINPFAFQASGWSQTFDSSGVTERSVGNATGTTFAAWQFVTDAGSDGTLTSVDIYAFEFGTPGSYTFDLELWTSTANPGGDPSTLVTNGSKQFNLSDLTGSAATFTVTFDTPPAISGSTAYWIVIHADQIDASNYLRVIYNLTGGSSWDHDASTDAVTWNAQDFDAFMRATINGQ